jgi:hypothetical protein
MSTKEMRDIMKAKIDHIPDEEVEKVFSKLINAADFDDRNKIDLHKYAPGIFEKYDELLKKFA